MAPGATRGPEALAVAAGVAALGVPMLGLTACTPDTSAPNTLPAAVTP